MVGSFIVSSSGVSGSLLFSAPGAEKINQLIETMIDLIE